MRIRGLTIGSCAKTIAGGDRATTLAHQAAHIVRIPLSPIGTSCGIAGGNAATTYYFRVRAVNAQGAHPLQKLRPQPMMG